MGGMEPEIVIIGAGMAGMNCARVLAEAGRRVVVCEASDGVGGRVRTDEVGGYRVDRGFQVLLTSYPEVRAVFDMEALRLREFFAGALVRRGGRWLRVANPLRAPVAAMRSLMETPPGWGDKLRSGLLTARLASGLTDPEMMEEENAGELIGRSVSGEMTDMFFRPFFGGVFLDRELRTSARWFAWLYRLFATGGTAVPAKGMGEMSGQLAGMLPRGVVRLGCRVRGLVEGGVVLDDGLDVRARAVVVAVEGREADRLLGREAGAMRATGAYAFGAERAPLGDGAVLLNGDGVGGGPVNHAAVMSNVSAELAPPGRALITAATLPGVEGWDDAEAVRKQLAGWFGPQVEGWELLSGKVIAEALPEEAACAPRFEGSPTRVRAGVYVCGDHTATPSINGALVSGRRAAEECLADW